MMVSAQKCEGVLQNNVIAINAGNSHTSGSTAAAPASTAKLPAAPPMMMLVQWSRFSHIVKTTPYTNAPRNRCKATTS